MTLRLAALSIVKIVTGPRLSVPLLATGADPQVAALNLPLADLGSEGYLIRQVQLGDAPAILVTGNSDAGVLYGAFALLRHLNSGNALAGIDRLEPRDSLCGHHEWKRTWLSP